MSRQQNHIIQRVMVEVEINAEDADQRPEAWLNTVSEWLHSTLLPLLEETLDRMSLPDQVVRLDQLTLDVGAWTGDHLHILSGPGEVQLQHAMEASIEAEPAGIQTVRRLSEAQKTVEAWLFFLKTGRLPWWQPPLPIVEWELKIRESFRHVNKEEVRFPSDEPALLRLTGLFSEVFLAELLQKKFPNEATEAVKAEVKEWLSVVDVKMLSPRIEEINRARSFKHYQPQNIPRGNVGGAKPKNDPGHPARQKEKEEISSDEEPAGALENKAGNELIHSADLVNADLPPHRTFDSKPLIEPVDKEEENESGIYVSNAGVVILHPFLELFFEAIGVADAGEITRPQQAVSWLQWLATGNANAPEYELPLNKLLCGLPLETPVVGVVEMSENDTKEAKELLEAVIRHWSVLKNTSPAGLQGTFLSRAGKLTPKADGDWLLQVEQKGFDVLLADLPWSISIIKLPWMPRLLWVEWT